MKTVYEQLAETGLAACTPLYSTEHIVRWNKLLELHFSNADNQDADRYYANAFELYEMGILGQIWSRLSGFEELRDYFHHAFWLLCFTKQS